MTATPASRPEPGDGLIHLGLLYDDVDDLVSRTLPEIRTVLDGGGDVVITADRGSVRRFRAALGDDAERVSFPSPQAAFGESTAEFLSTLRTWVRPDRRTLIVGQYSTAKSPVWDCAYAEDAVNLVLGDLPLTVLCVCERSGAEAHRALTTHAHAFLVADGGRVANAHYNPPVNSCPAPMAPWGEPVLEMTVRGGADLAAVRRGVAGVATRAGLHGEARGAAVLAVHEAVLLAGRAELGPVPGLPDGEQDVRVRVAGGAMVTEVLASATRPVIPPPRTHDDDTAPSADDLRRSSLPRFCDQVVVHDGPDGRLVRVLSAAP